MVDTVYVLPTDPVIAIGFTTEPLTVVDCVNPQLPVAFIADVSIVKFTVF